MTYEAEIGHYRCGECGYEAESANRNTLTEAMLFHHCPPICATGSTCPACDDLENQVRGNEP